MVGVLLVGAGGPSAPKASEKMSAECQGVVGAGTHQHST